MFSSHENRKSALNIWTLSDFDLWGSFKNVFTSLLVTKDEVNPLMNLTGDEFGFQSLAIDPNKLVRIRGPGRQFHVVHGDLLLSLVRGLGLLGVADFIVFQAAQLVSVHVGEHLGEAEEFGNQFLQKNIGLLILDFPLFLLITFLISLVCCAQSTQVNVV